MSVAGTAADTRILEANLGALRKFNPGSAAAIARARARTDIRFVETLDQTPTPEIVAGDGAQALASRRRPRAEATAFADSVDISRAGLYLVAGFGAGYHVRAVLDRLKRQGLVIAFEPDIALLRACLEHIDCSAWLGEPNLRLLTDAEDRGAMAAAVERAEGLVGMGVMLVEHPASRARLGETTGKFYRHLADVIDGVKMAVLTTLMQSRITIRNLTQNLDHYVASAGIVDLAGACAGRPGVVISAGPSLARNIELLAAPGVRERFALVATQTVLKPLLSRGIHPHFITALDWSDVGARFYEGLSESDVEGITLVAEPKVNPAVLEAWPGALRCVGDGLCDRLLGEEFARPKGALPAGATVAHLAYSLARFLGCDPVALVGQDLGFTDGQYYASGAAIHNVWAGELNEFNTLEMLEWQRIVRQGSHLRRATDILGRPMYTDEQMLTYLTQFEREFKEDEDRGLTTIDATEGGVRKQHTRVHTLREFIDEYGHRGTGPLTIPPTPARVRGLNSRVAERVRTVRKQVARIGELSRRAAVHLAEIAEHQQDQRRVDRLIGQIEPLTREAISLEPAYVLVHSLGQTAAFDRMRADRGMEVEASLSPMERQRRQVERDATNVRALERTAEQLGELLESAARSLGGEAKVTRDKAQPTHETRASSTHEVVSRIAALLPLRATDTHVCELLGGKSILAHTVGRLRQASVGLIVVVTDDVEAARSIAAKAGVADGLRFAQAEPGEIAQRGVAARRARAFAGACWRGGIGGASVYDEVYLPRSTPRVLDEIDAGAALVLGPNWCCIDPAVCRAVIERYAENAREHPFVFSQAAPGLGPCLVSRSMAGVLAAAPERGPACMPIGGILAYVPKAPVNDLIAGAACVGIGATIRDLGARCIADTLQTRKWLAGILSASASSGTLDLNTVPVSREAPAHLALEVAPGESRRMFGVGDAAIDEHAAAGLLAEWAALVPDGRLSLIAGGDEGPDHSLLARLARVARDRGVFAVHVRTSLRCEALLVDELLAAKPYIISVDALGASATTYAAITGADDFGRVSANLDRLRRASAAGGPLIVPRLIRRDIAYSDVEPFFARWFDELGWCVVEGPPARVGEDRVEPLTIPNAAARREARERLTVLADGTVCAEPAWTPGANAIGRLGEAPLSELWTRALRARGIACGGSA